MTKADILALLIPRNDFWLRDGHNIVRALNMLSYEEKNIAEEALIEKIDIFNNMTDFNVDRDVDNIIIATLVCMKSQQCVPALYRLMAKCMESPGKYRYQTVIRIACGIYQLVSDENVIQICFNQLQFLSDDAKSLMFVYMGQLNNYKLNEYIGKYIDNSDFSIAYRAKLALKIITTDKFFN